MDVSLRKLFLRSHCSCAEHLKHTDTNISTQTPRLADPCDDGGFPSRVNLVLSHGWAFILMSCEIGDVSSSTHATPEPSNDIVSYDMQSV